jgi:hypothetical protein
MKDEQALSINHEEKLLLISLIKEKQLSIEIMRKNWQGYEDVLNAMPFYQSAKEKIEIADNLVTKIESVII